jgi:ribosomal protein S2
MHLLYISIVQLSNYKIFIGHSILNTLLLSSWLIFNIRGRITILNLYHTIKMLKLSYIWIKHIINAGFPFWFVNFDLTKEEIIKYNSYITGEFYVTRRWIRGLISNFFVITKAYRKYSIKKEFVESNKVKDLYNKWILTRFTWPRAIFISNAVSSLIASKEAASAKVPTIALVDTNVKTFLYNLPVGCNDDSIESIGFMNSIISQYILKCKYKKILIWYYFNKNVKRFKTLLEWLKISIKLKKKIIYKIQIKDIKLPKFYDYYSEIKKSLNFFFGRSYNYKLFFKNNNNVRDNLFLDLFYDKNKILFFNKFKVLNYKILSYKYRIKFKRYKLLRKINGVSSFKSFLNNFIKLGGLIGRTKRIKIKKRINIARKRVSISFKNFFVFIFFFFLNKFNIIIDNYNVKNLNLLYLIKIYKNYKNKKLKYKNKPIKKYKFDYMFRYKSKKIYKRRKLRKYINYYNIYDEISKKKNNINFFFFYWKYFIIFLGLKISVKSYYFKKKYILNMKTKK